MAKNYKGETLTESEKYVQPCVPIEVSKGVFMSRDAVWTRAKNIIKTHPRMDGSGHLLQKNPDDRFKAPDLNEMISYVKAELKKQNINPDKCRIEPLIQSCLPKLVGRKDWHHKKDFAEKAKRKERLKKEALYKAKRMQQRQSKPAQKVEREPVKNESPFPTLTLKSNLRQETRVVTVTVKKARNFHYPLDLPSGGEK
ncbi:hypothetical protein [Acidithiobacillus sp. HP-11]|uniref:hypothetical protein n=1 Tax=Acidithiobacillus sp. HP-11 TaxID=2697656 RepID=UPI00187A1BFF|nr:hypothetical protein [Acidithiobacillus sp. HP-11]MBE7566829.1 hypothetical protein [Acidithiobacillus sp. HP-11]